LTTLVIACSVAVVWPLMLNAATVTVLPAGPSSPPNCELHVAAGTIRFTPDHELRAGERIRLVSLTPPEAGGSLRPLFVRDVTSLDSRPRLPAGKAIALLIDGKERIVAISKPISITAGNEPIAWPESDRNRNTVVAWLRRPRPAAHPDQDPVAITAADTKGDHKPDAFVNAADSLFSVWYNLDGPSARLVIDSPQLRLSRDRVTIAAGSVATVDERLELLPTLTVAVGAFPPKARNVPTSMSLTISPARDETKTIRNIIVKPAQSYTIASLPATLLTLNLRIGEFLMEKHVDLSSGQDAKIDLALVPLIVSGSVYLNDVPVRARIRFLQHGEPLVVETDDNGSYEVTLWQPQRYIIETTMADRPAMPPFSQNISITSSVTLDIRLPANALSARERVIEIPMTTLGDVIHLTVRIEGGAPAAGAEVAAWNGEQLIWHGTADESGQIAIPKSVAGTRIFVRHPSAASVVALLAPDQPTNSLSLQAAAPPLLVRVVHKDQKPIGPRAATVAVWFGGVRVSGPVAGFMTWSLGATSSDGTWVAKGLPAGALRMFASSSATAAQIESGIFDRLATAIPYPWPAVAIVEVADE
jgi:hypothetical protein